MWSLKMSVFWDVAPCSLVNTDWSFREAYCLHHQGNSITTKLHSATSQKTAVFILVSARASNLTDLKCKSGDLVGQFKSRNRENRRCRNISRNFSVLIRAECDVAPSCWKHTCVFPTKLPCMRYVPTALKISPLLALLYITQHKDVSLLCRTLYFWFNCGRTLSSWFITDTVLSEESTCLLFSVSCLGASCESSHHNKFNFKLWFYVTIKHAV
jgi:hypothetical protein